LTRLIIRRDERVIVVEGPAEYGLCRAMIRGLAPDRVTAAAGLPLELIGGLLKNCSTFIGNDSGIAHLAAGSGCSCLVLFGPTNPSLWAPVGKSVEVLREADGCDKCRGGSGRHSCMENVTVDDVWHRLNNLNGSPRAT
jgi:ADP-heptose:LPS heptosyltransferase